MPLNLQIMWYKIMEGEMMQRGTGALKKGLQFPNFPSDASCHAPVGPRSLRMKRGYFLLLSLMPGDSVNSDKECRLCR